MSGKGIDAEVRVMFFRRANRTGGTGDERHHRELSFSFRFRLPVYAALFTMIAKQVGRELATGIAVDATGIDKEIPWNILR